ncbi:helix-turn-helix transcriptional regulator [Paenibacillus sp. N1-5-1-14]|uniref:helix-turn-helix domain-containing protein n=1 Tax=Paenibacillus radicibacter TaxID=2972488 RepID=UPI0021598EC7|nr:helix-turn-helix transcriptional regulator [Paenibacillus radicibacter]MCR8641486.1 helix-turn-helix transcriptional regulator [Paenibacillus radicibacter]
MQKKRRVIKSKLDDLLIKHKLDQRSLHKITKVREATIGDMANDENKTFTRENLNKIINALGIEDIDELITIVDEEEDTTNSNNESTEE